MSVCKLTRGRGQSGDNGLDVVLDKLEHLCPWYSGRGNRARYCIADDRDISIQVHQEEVVKITHCFGFRDGGSLHRRISRLVKLLDDVVAGVDSLESPLPDTGNRRMIGIPGMQMEKPVLTAVIIVAVAGRNDGLIRRQFL